MSEKDDKYFGDMIYEAWRNGDNPDEISRDEAKDYQEAYYEPEEAAELHFRKHREQEEDA